MPVDSPVRVLLTNNWDEHRGNFAKAKGVLSKYQLRWTSDGALRAMLHKIKNELDEGLYAGGAQRFSNVPGNYPCTLRTNSDGRQYVEVPVPLNFGDYYETSFNSLRFFGPEGLKFAAEFPRFWLEISDGENQYLVMITSNGSQNWYHSLGKVSYDSAILAASAALGMWRQCKKLPEALGILFPG